MARGKKKQRFFPLNFFLSLPPSKKRNTGKRVRINYELSNSLFPSLAKEKLNPLKHYYYFLMCYLAMQKNISSKNLRNSGAPLGKHPLSRYKSLIFSSFENSTILNEDKVSNKSVTAFSDRMDEKIVDLLNSIEENVNDE